MEKYEKPVPEPDRVTGPFWEGAKQNKLLFHTSFTHLKIKNRKTLRAYLKNLSRKPLLNAAARAKKFSKQ